MAIKLELDITIKTDGSILIKTKGFKGGECDEALSPIELALGRITSKDRTPEYYEKKVSKLKTHSKTK